MNLYTPNKTLKIITASCDVDFNRAADIQFFLEYQKLLDSGIEMPNITLASGQTQDDLYRLWCGDQEKLDLLSKARFFELDDYITSGKSLKDFMEEALISNVFKENIPANQWINFRNDTSPRDSAMAMEAALDVHGPIDLAVLGLGAEGDDHYGMVQANMSVENRVTDVELSDGMKKSYQGYTDGTQDVPDYAVTLSHAAMPSNVIVMARGEHKAKPVYNMLCAGRKPFDAPDISTTYLRDLQNVTVILDEAAASEINKYEGSWPQRAERFDFIG